jgi:hypothetical protein
MDCLAKREAIKELRDGRFGQTQGKSEIRSRLYLVLFHVHQLSWVDYLAPARPVPTFAIHHFECSMLVGRSANPALSAETNIFLR